MIKELPVKKLKISMQIECSYDYDGYKLDSTDFNDMKEKIKNNLKSEMWRFMGDEIFYENESENCGENDFVIDFTEFYHYKD